MTINTTIDNLLLQVQNKEVEVFDINLTDLARQFLLQEELLLYPGARFIAGLSHLIYLKAHKLVPEETTEEEQEDFSQPTLEQLEEYASFKNVAKTFSHIEREQSDCFWRPQAPMPEVEAPRPVVMPLDLEEFQRLFLHIWQKARERTNSIFEEEWSVADALIIVRQQLTKKRLSLQELFPQEYSKERLIVTFLAVLELLKNQEAQLAKEQEGWCLLCL